MFEGHFGHFVRFGFLGGAQEPERPNAALPESFSLSKEKSKYLPERAGVIVKYLYFVNS